MRGIGRKTSALALVFVAFCSNACVHHGSGRVVGDVRVANGWISIDRCELSAVAYKSYAITNCTTENVYIGPGFVPKQ
jgi:hypothetical protein